MSFARRAYPRSFRRLLAVGFVLVGVPAAIGLVALAFSVSSFADRAERAIYDARVAAQASREFAEAVTALERNARQWLILEDRALLEAYEANRRKFNESLERLRALDADDRLRSVLDDAAAVESESFAAVSLAVPADPPSPAADDNAAKPAPASAAQVAQAAQAAREAKAHRDRAIAGFERLRELAPRVQREGADRVDREADALRETAASVRQIALAQAIALVPLMAVLVVGFTVLVGRPIRELDAAIRRLGAGNFSEPVHVDGPDDLVELGRRLDWMRNALIGLERDKNRFMQEIAHSLKTSLAALREGTELLVDGATGPLNDEQREIADILRRNAIELQGLIVGLLQYGQAWSQRTALSVSRWDCKALVDEIVGRHELALRSKRLAVLADVRCGAVRADRDKVAAILDNLLSNAIRYSPRDAKIEVRARLENGRLSLEVADEGPGVAPEERERIFDPFVQGRTVGSGLVPGSGIGLAIAREHALAHGGTIGLVDGGRGARFRVTLPAEVG